MSSPSEIAGFKILSRVGEGAASVLYVVQDPKTKQIRALKHVLKKSDKDQRFIEQTENEYDVGSRLHHPALRSVEKLIRHRKMLKVHSASLVMEFVDGDTLDQKPPLPQLEVIRIFREVAEGLAYMHGKGFVHADLKPNNILVTHHGAGVKIIDLGQGCRVGTIKKRIQGTPGYMAPEQAHREAITPKTDIYNFGATMYWVLTRDVIPTALPPKDESNLYSGALDAEQVEPPIPPHERNKQIHPLLSRLILDCVKVDPAERPDSMQGVATRLEMLHDLLTAPPERSFVVEDNEETTF